MKSNSTVPAPRKASSAPALNAFRHGLTGQTVVISPEDQKSHSGFCRGFFDDYKPEGALEHQLVQIIANCLWRLNRITANEQSLLSLDTIQCEEDHIKATDDRAVTACASARSFEMHVKTLANLTLYEQRIARQFERTLKLLKETQAERKRQQASDLHDAVMLKEYHDELQAQQPQPVPYNPADDQFVFSNGMLEAHMASKDRRNAALDAWYERHHPEEKVAA